MGASMRYPVLLLTVLCFTFSELKTVKCDHETFDHTMVEWCNASIYAHGRFCETTEILHSNSLLENLPNDHTNLRYITITNQNIPALYQNSISNMNIYSLTINSCGIEDIEIGAFTGTTFATLDISNNKLKKLRKGSFEDANIEGDLLLRGNGMTDIEDGVFEGMTLSSIQLSNNNLETISSGVFKNLNVDFISLKGNKFTSVKKDMLANAENLQLVDLSHNRIQLVEPESFQNMKTPAFVYLQNNLLDSVPAGVFNSKLFVELLLYGNNISRIEPKAFDRSGVGYLNLTGNNIKEIKVGMFEDNSEIEYLIMSQNQIKSIQPHALDRVLRGVDLSSNNIRILKKDTFKAVRIIVLLKNKMLKKIEVGAFSDDDGGNSYYYNKDPRTLYLEEDNLLDEESKNYLRNLTSSGSLIWRHKIDGIVF